MRDDTEVAINHYASFLEHQKKSPIFPDGFIKETIQTFCLLFPQFDRGSRKWFRAQQTIFSLDDKLGHADISQRKSGRLKIWSSGMIESLF
jgi:hypothetical protein